MLQLLRLLHLPFWRRSPAGFLLPALGVALGVATVVAIDLAGAGAVRSFRDTVERLDGRTTHRVGGVVGAPVEDGLARRLAELPGVVAAAPVMEGVGLHVAPGSGGEETGEGLRLLGIDPLSEGAIRSLGVEGATGGTAVSAGGGQREAEEREDLFRAFLGEPGALLVSAPFLRRHALEAGDSLSLVVGARRRSAHVLAALPEEVGGLPVPDNLAVGDVATLQELTGRVRGVDRVDLVLAREDRSGVERRVRAALPTGARLERPGAQAGRLERGLAAFRANVRALSYLALFVSFFLIYNSLLISVLRRRPMLGIARCLGATRRQVLAGWMGEALLTGVVGAAAGVALGIAFARPALREVARTAQDLYGATGRGSLAVDAGTLAKAVAVGLAFTLLSALLPAAEAAGTPPAHTAARSGVERAARGGRRVARGVAALLGCLGAAALAWPTASATPGYAAAVLLALTAALLVPDGVELATRAALSRRFGLPGGVARMAAANIRANRSRTGVAVAALTVALAMSVAMATLVGSFRADLLGWIAASVRADVYVSPLGLQADREGAALPAGLESRLAQLPQVEAVDAHRGGPAVVLGRDVVLAAVEVPVLRRRVAWPILGDVSQEAFFDRLERGQAAVSETLHRKTGLAAGSRFALEREGVVDSLMVAGVYRDYSTDRGVVLVDRSAYAGAPELGPPRSLALYLRAGEDVDAFVSTLQRGAGADLALLVRSNRELRRRALAVFERTFAITRAMEAVGLAVAAIGVLGALLAMLLERGRELATLRALGLTRRQLAGLFLAESTLLALLAWAFALVLGGALAWILLAVINVRSFGWALEFRLPWAAFGAALLASVGASWLATLWPLRRLAALRLAPLLREE